MMSEISKILGKSGWKKFVYLPDLEEDLKDTMIMIQLARQYLEVSLFSKQERWS